MFSFSFGQTMVRCVFLVYTSREMKKKKKKSELLVEHPGLCVCVCVPTASKMWLCDHPHGPVLVYRVHPSGCDRSAARHPLSHDGHHGGQRGISTSTMLVKDNKLMFFIDVTVSAPSLLPPGLCPVPERLQHALHRWTAGGHRC